LNQALTISFSRWIIFLIISIAFLYDLFNILVPIGRDPVGDLIIDIIVLMGFLPITIVLSIKFFKYLKIRKYVNSLEMMDMGEERKAVEGRL